MLVEAPPEALDRALDRLAAAAPALQEAVLDACATCVRADDEVSVQEETLLRAVAAALDIPLPVQLEDR